MDSINKESPSAYVSATSLPLTTIEDNKSQGNNNIFSTIKKKTI